MKTRIKIQTDKYPDVSWPEGLALPAAGDRVLLTQAGETLDVVVDHRVFGIGADAQGAPTAEITIHAHHQTPGSV